MPAGSGLALNSRVFNIFPSTGFDDIGTDAYLWNNLKSQLSFKNGMLVHQHFYNDN